MSSVFVNRTLNLRQIQAIGFDMDHTLVQYNIYNFEKKTYQLLLEKLVQEKNYPEQILDFQFSLDQVIRGLIIDIKRGYTLKVSRYRSIRNIYYGEKKVAYTNRREIYPNDYIHFGIDHPDFSFVESHFSLASTLAYMQLIELKKTNNQVPDSPTLFSDIHLTMYSIHNDDLVKKSVMKDIKHYIKINPKIAQELEKFIQHGKKLFLLTNSNIQYTNFLMSHTITPFLKKHSDWKDIFEYVITSAHKPDFFHKDKDFETIDKDTFNVTQSVSTPSPGIYRFGCAQGLTQALQLKELEILYIGDQVYTDVVLLKQKCGWRTALVIEELEKEKEITNKNKVAYKEIKHLMEQKIPIETQINKLMSEQIEQNHKNHDSQIKELLKKTEGIDQQLSKKIVKVNQTYNSFWGELMRVGMEESLFASQAERFSCIYMPHIIDFLSQSPRTYYRAKKRLFPHEM